MIYISFKNNDSFNPDLHQQIFNNLDTSIVTSSDIEAKTIFKNNPTGYLESVINSVDTLFCLPFSDGGISYFSGLEINLAIENKKDCYYVSSIFPFEYEQITDIGNYNVLTLEETQIKINQEMG